MSSSAETSVAKLMCRYLSLILIMICSVAGVSGQTFEVSPGLLATERNIPARSEVLKLTGSADASDLAYLVSAIESAGTLDLSALIVVGYKGPEVGVGIYSSQADVLPPYIFAGLNVSQLMLPESLTAISDGAFLDSRISSVTLPAGVTAIGSYAFSQCQSLARIVLPDGVQCVSDKMFEGCVSLTSVSLPSHLSSIGSGAFLGCSSLQSLSLPSSLVSVGDEAFALSGLDAIDMSLCSGLVSIGARAFAGCMHLASATLPASAVGLGEGLFFDCSSLTSVALPSEAVHLPDYLLKGAASLTSLALPAGTASIGTLAMAGTTALTDLDASALTEVPALGADVWEGVTQASVALSVDPQLADSYLSTPQWQEFAIERSGITLVTGNGHEVNVTASFAGKILTVTSQEPIRHIAIYAIDGRMLIDTNPLPDVMTDHIDTSRYPGALFIVRVDVGNDKIFTFKLLRKS